MKQESVLAALLRSLLVALLVLLVVPYYSAGFARVPLTLCILIPLAAAILSPSIAVACFLGVLPLLDAFIRPPAGASWLEPAFLGLAIGVIARTITGKQKTPAVVFWYAGAMSCVAAWHLVPSLARTPGLARSMWLALPIHNQSWPFFPFRTTLLLLLPALVIAVIHAAFAAKPRHVVLALWMWIGGSLAAAAEAARMWFAHEGFHWPRVESWFEDVNSYASFLLLAVFITVVLLHNSRGRLRLLAAVSLVINTIVLCLAGSRMALIAASIGLLLLRFKNKRRLFVISACILLACATLLFTGHLKTFRLGVWTAAFRAFTSAPVLGIGPGKLYSSLGHYYSGDDTGWLPAQENAHNYFLQIAAETGLAGLSIFLALVVFTLKKPLQAPDKTTNILAIGCVCYLLTCITGHPLLLTRQILFFWSYVAITCRLLQQELPGNGGPQSPIATLPLG